jgi:hypothetical protein
MTGQQFSGYLHDPGLVDDQSLQMFEDFVMRYPYCQTGQILLAFNLYAEGDNQYPDQLKKAAAYAGDRSVLKELIGYARNIPVIPAERQKIPTPVSTPAPMPQPVLQAEWNLQPETVIPVMIESVSSPYERMTQEELLAIVNKRLEEIAAEKRFEPTYTPDPASYPKQPVSKASLIEKFIMDEPRISKPNTAFFNATDSAIRSNFDDEEIVSETLAQLYAQQGNIQKAIHIYEKLSLLNQEKSRFFAAQIEKLNS